MLDSDFRKIDFTLDVVPAIGALIECHSIIIVNSYNLMLLTGRTNGLLSPFPIAMDRFRFEDALIKPNIGLGLSIVFLKFVSKSFKIRSDSLLSRDNHS